MKMKKGLFFIVIAAMLIFSSCSAEKAAVENEAYAMGSVVGIKLYSDNSDRAREVSDDVVRQIQQLDKIISKNDKTSELSSVNSSLEQGVQVSRELFDIIENTVEIYSMTNKKAAVTSGALTELWGIDTDDFTVPEDDEIKTALSLCDDENLLLDRNTLTVCASQGQIINLGSVGKGAACDKAVEVLLSNDEIEAGIISVGGSVALYSNPSENREWTIGIRNPFGEINDSFATLTLGSCFVSTSGNYEKTFEKDGVTYHHLLDLTTGTSSNSELCSVTVVAHSGLESDALSTACYLLGETASYPLLQKYNASAVFVYSDKTVSVSQTLSESIKITNSEFTVE